MVTSSDLRNQQLAEISPSYVVSEKTPYEAAVWRGFPPETSDIIFPRGEREAREKALMAGVDYEGPFEKLRAHFEQKYGPLVEMSGPKPAFNFNADPTEDYSSNGPSFKPPGFKG